MTCAGPTRPWGKDATEVLVFGQAMQQAMASRGCHLSLDESRQLTRSLMRLAELGALVPIDQSASAALADVPDRLQPLDRVVPLG